MPLAVFLRAVNVGGRRCDVKSLAAELGMDNVGAAGTFVARRASARGAAPLAKAIRAKLPFDCEVMIVPGDDLLALAARNPFAGRGVLPPGGRGHVSVLAAPAKTKPKLPIEAPQPPERFTTRFVELDGRFALCVRTAETGPRVVYPNELVEKTLGVAATTRGFDTILRMVKLVEAA